jgi:D-threo-aldose 1-dehydrogenase
VLPTRELSGTGVITSAVGFGCAGLFSIPERGDRRLILDSVYDAGIRHFDVAPMYGLGLAEAELAPFLSRRSDVTVTTKFGIEPTLLARSAAPFQRPVRAFLSDRRSIREGLKVAGRGPRSGLVGRALYSAPAYDQRSAQLALERSLRTLRRDCIDVFLLHDPAGGLIRGARELVGFLDDQCRLGRIRTWGVTGQPSLLSEVMELLGPIPVIQLRDDIFEAPPGVGYEHEGGQVTYGALARALPVLHRFLARSGDAGAQWSERLGIDPGAQEPGLARTLLSTAVRRNTAGPVLFTTTRPERARLAAQAAVQGVEQAGADSETLMQLVDAVRHEWPEMIPTP